MRFHSQCLIKFLLRFLLLDWSTKDYINQTPKYTIAGPLILVKWEGTKLQKHVLLIDGWVPSQLLFGADSNSCSHTIYSFLYFYDITFTSSDSQQKLFPYL